MSVDNPDVVDAIGTDRTSGTVVLTVSDHLGWGDDADEHIAALKLKLEHYVHFIRSGQLYEAYPKARDRKAVIEVVQKDPPDTRGHEWLEFVQTELADIGLDFSWRVLERDDAP
jgi:hypothetical protein